ncbi:Hint domain-containing protein [Shimia aestuarii]|uniref:Hint domain-containing protein n=1 Tax=Shimia aestuarii TaxID=254406 RepID=A0A1I4K7P5_9RHOB|nr:Hint domain-containing protein [Shimia aestuarii]SFL74506.1 Hint domain-containing protein [Shimia aestuarii]
MSWIALCDTTRAHFRADGLARHAQPLPKNGPDLHRPMVSGSFVLETQVSPYDRPQLLIGYRSPRQASTALTLQAVPGGGIVLVMTRGAETFHAAVNLDTGGRTDILRVTYSWDLRARRGRLTVERPGRARIAMRELTDPMPLSRADLRDMVMKRELCVLSSDISYVAASDRIEPVGPMPSLCPNTPVMTGSGYRPASDIRRGDVVQTLEGSLVPVLATFRRTVPAAGLFAPVRLRSPYFGLTQDITVSPSQQLVIGGSRVEYLFGSEHVLVPSGPLTHGKAASKRKGDLLITYCQLMLPDHEAVLCAGTYLETLNIGRIRRKRDALRASLLCTQPRSSLPEHSRTVFPVLGEFEALTLAAQRAAA